MTPSEAARVAAEGYADAPPVVRLFQRLRPRICPLERVVALVPPAARVLDVGCGAGLLLALLARDGRLGAGLGVDSAPAALAIAAGMRARLPEPDRVRFERRDAGDLPAGTFDVVALIDVLHHVPRPQQYAAVAAAASRVAAGGTLIVKDIAPRPRWRAAMNRLHDLLLARQWVHHLAGDTVAAWCAQLGLALEVHERIDRWWYAHELVVARRPAQPSAAGGAPLAR